MKVGGVRNFGYGKQLSWAGRQAVADRYGAGHFASVEAHARRWEQVADYLRNEHGIRDARFIEKTHVEEYARELRERVAEGEMKVAYAQNLLSTVNVVLAQMRGDQLLSISPSDSVGPRSFVRGEAPAWMRRAEVAALIDDLRSEVRELEHEIEFPMNEELVASQVELGRELGMRWRETVLVDAQRLYDEAQRGSITISNGTKGGRDRELRVAEHQFQVIERAASLQERLGSTSFIKFGQNYRQFSEAASRIFYAHGGHHFHDLRAAYACSRYEQLTGHPAPCVAGEMLASREADRRAREIITAELGHGRLDVVAAYIGGRG